MTITAEIVLVHKIWQTNNKRPFDKAKNYLISQQREHGVWELFYGDRRDLYQFHKILLQWFYLLVGI